MSRDMKQPRKTPPRKTSGGGTLLGLFIGLVVGVIAVAGVVWYVNKVPLPFTTTGQQAEIAVTGQRRATPGTDARSAGARPGTGGAAWQARRFDGPRKTAL
jgi:hypothetical protein